MEENIFTARLQNENSERSNYLLTYVDKPATKKKKVDRFCEQN